MKKKEKAKVKKRSVRPYFRVFFQAFLSLLLVATLVGAYFTHQWVMATLDEAPELQTSLLRSRSSGQILDRHGELVMEPGIQRRNWVAYADIADVMIDAILAIEDARFFNHEGVDWTRTIAAQISNMRVLVEGEGGLQGGSTITQQLINQTHLLDEDGQREVTVERKLQEIMLAFQVERIFSKEQILEAYLNRSPFGGNIYGIQAAAEFYFGVDASELTLSQAATLAGLVQMPNVWRPDRNTHLTEIRRNEVLEMMVRHGFITEELRDLAAAEPILDMMVYQVPVALDTDYYDEFINHVFNEALERFNVDPHEGYRIYTFLDRDIQRQVHRIMTTNDYLNWPNERFQGATAIIETQTGRIRALGGRQLQNATGDDRGWIMATDTRRQIGSASKPIWAHGAAFELLNWGPGTMMDDDEMNSASGTPLNNWNRRFQGRIDLWETMVRSWNIPSVRAGNAARNPDPERFADFIVGLGFDDTILADGSRSILLEGAAIGTHESTPLEMAGAYAAFGNGGIFNEPVAIQRIVDPYGQEIYVSQHSERAMRPDTAYLITSMLRDVVTHPLGTGGHASVPGLFVAGKTGTTDWGPEGLRLGIPANAVPDAWFVGYSSEFTVSSWVGYNTHEDGLMFGGAGGTHMAGNAFRVIMSHLPHPYGSQAPARPGTVTSVTVELRSGEEDGETCRPSDATPDSFRRTKLFIAGHGPSCDSDRFSNPEAPENFRVSGSGTTLTFNWNHVEMADLLAGGGNLTPGRRALLEDVMEAVGEVEYVVVANLTDGGTTNLVITEDNSATYTITSVADLARIQSFHVVARFSDNTASSSDPSNTVANDGLVDPGALTLEIPSGIIGWTRTQLYTWADLNGVELMIYEAHSEIAPVGTVISTNPTGVLNAGQVLNVVISTGPNPDIPTLESDDLPEIIDPALEGVVPLTSLLSQPRIDLNRIFTRRESYVWLKKRLL